MLANSFGQRTLVQGTEEVRYGFTSRELDDTGLIYYRARTYDPATGTFLQRDPIGFASGDLNLYAYVENNPYNWSDPTGLSQLATARQASSAPRRVQNTITPVGAGVLGLATAITSYLVFSASLDIVLSEAQSEERPRLSSIPIQYVTHDTDPFTPEQCERLYAQIQWLTNETRRRYFQYQADTGTLPETGGFSRAGHRIAYFSTQRALVNRLNYANFRGCTGYDQNAWTWATRPLIL